MTQFIKFLVVGAGNTVFGYSVFAALILCGVAAVPALVITYMVGVPFNFFTTRRFVFARAPTSSFPRFVAAYVVIYFFNLGAFRLVEATGAGALVTQALCIPVVAVFSFVLFKFQVFREPAEPRAPSP
jgi:putative flippase GtrA